MYTHTHIHSLSLSLSLSLTHTLTHSLTHSHLLNILCFVCVSLMLTLFNSHPSRLANLRSRVLEARMVAPLFDTQLYARDLEKLFRRMWDRYEQGLPPDHLLNC